MSLTRNLTEIETVILQKKWKLDATTSQSKQLEQDTNGKEGTINFGVDPAKTRTKFQVILGPWWKELENEDGERKSLRTACSFERTIISHIDESLNNKRRA